jgi:predicted dehydrogenase
MLKVAIFGVGHLGKFHINNWKEIEGVEIVGFFDPNNDTALEVEKTHAIERFIDSQKLIEACDIVDIVVPTDMHFDLCIAAIRKGKHVFVEKPMTHTMEQAKELIAMVKEAGVKFGVGHVERFNPAFLAIQKMELKPMFIEVHRLAQFNPRGTEVSVILDLMIHDIDIILSIVKSSVKNIYASGVAVMTETPDIANVRIEFNNGCVANLTSSRISMKKMRKMRIFQKDAYIGLDFLDKKAEIIKIKQPQDIDVFAFDVPTPSGIKTIAVANPVVEQANAILLELQSFVTSILQNNPAVVNEMDGYYAMEVAHLILNKIGKATVIS